MKNLYGILAIMALAFAVSCETLEQQQEPEQPAAMEFKITSANPMVVLAEGGDYAISYSITSPDENLEVFASRDVEWIRIKGSSGDDANNVYFSVEPNESEQSRSAVIVVTYDRDYKVVVNQAGAKPEPKEILSTLTHDVDMVMTDEDLSSYAFADYYGGAYGDGRGMWQFWLMDVVNDEMVCLEILTEGQGDVPTADLVIPTGEFVTTEDAFTYDVLVGGYRTVDMDGPYDGGSWYWQTNGIEITASAPIAEGKFNIEYNNSSKGYHATFDLIDDVGNKITGVYNGSVTIEDFRY